MDDFSIGEGPNEFGVAREITVEGDQVVTKLTYDAEPLIERAAEARAMTAGERWGDGQLIGTVPIAEMARIVTTYRSSEERKHQILVWLRDNPKLVMFDRFLK